MSEAEVRRQLESVSLQAGSMRLNEAMREASRLGPVENEDLRKEQVKAVTMVVGQLKTEKAIADCVSALEPDEEDNLMKFVYLGLSMKDAALSLPLFKVHEALTKKAGLGCIVRAVCAK